MPTNTWMYFGNRSFLDPSPTSNITNGQAGAAVGWTATGPEEFGPTEVTGSPSHVINGGQVYNTTYQGGGGGQPTANFSYVNPVTDAAVTSTQMRTFISVTVRIDIPEAHGGGFVTRTGALQQMSNGDVFFRPSSGQAALWDSVPAMQTVTITAASMLSDTTYPAAVGFNPGIYDVPVACFVRGTMIEAEHGPVPVEDLRVGDLVRLGNGGLKPVSWCGQSVKNAEALTAAPHLRPVRIKAGALGPNVPHSDLLVSPQHRVLVRSRIAQRMFGTDEVLVAAKQLVGVPGIQVAEDVETVDYFHFLLDEHSIVISNGAETESMFAGAEALKSVGPLARLEILELFPELAEADHRPLPARELVAGRRGRKLAERHIENGISLNGG